MPKQNVLFKLLLLIVINFYITWNSTAQTHIGVEAGSAISGLYSFSEKVERSELYRIVPFVGATGGIFIEKEFTNFFSLRICTFYTLKGLNIRGLDQSYFFHNISIPIIATFAPIKPLRLGIGIEPSAYASGFSYIYSPTFAFGLRTEIGWQISKKFRLIGYFSCDFTPLFEFEYSDINGNPYNVFFTSLSGGITVAYTIKIW